MRIHPSIVSTVKFSSCIAMACSSAIIAKEVYHISLQVLKGSIPCPSLELSVLTCAIVATGYCSLKLSGLLNELKASEISISTALFPTREIVAFDQGELIGPPPGASQ